MENESVEKNEMKEEVFGAGENAGGKKIKFNRLSGNEKLYFYLN